MTFKSTRLRDAILSALVTGTVGIAGTGIASAQDSPQQSPPPEEQQSAGDDEATELDTIVVTGTRIQSQTITASSPVAEIDQEEFKFTGTTRVEDLVNQYPQMEPVFDSFRNNGAQGYPTADLRGLGAGRTLVLVNGQRLAPGAGLARDLSQIPAALVKRVDILTGGASAVYGSDAVAGVVNFILDTEFEGFNINLGYSAYQHSNDNDYAQRLQDEAGYPYESGNSGFDGKSRNIDLVWGSRFADDAGHASAWLSYRRNDPLFQSQRDYASCALDSAGTACGGSVFAARPNFLILDAAGTLEPFESYANIAPDGTWQPGLGELYNFAPISYYQRPEDRLNFGASLKYEINAHFRPYVKLMYVNRENSIQGAESGTFFADAVTVECGDPLINTLCADLALDASEPLTIFVGKRNVEGGPRITELKNSAYRVVAGAEGALGEAWSYNVAALFARTDATNVGKNDFLADRVLEAMLGCPPGSFDGCLFYNVWVPNGVTAEAAQALAGVSTSIIDTALTSVNGYVTGDLGFGIPSADGDPVSLVVGGEWRKEEFAQDFDSNSQAGNFTGAGGPAPPISGQTEVTELFLEAAVPVLKDVGFVDSFNLDLGYRRSDYERSGRANTYKLGFNSVFFGSFRLRGGYNRAIRAPNIDELFVQQQIAIFGGDDPCAGATPEFTLAQCQNTDVTPEQYGNIPRNSANQYNHFVGGNPHLEPEQADTYTIGLAATPIESLEVAVDYYDIKLEERIGSIGAQTILDFCGTTGDPFLCDKVNRNPTTGDLWIGNDIATAGYVENLTSNFGDLRFRGIDLNFSYDWDLFGGRMTTSLVGTRTLEAEVAPLPGVNDDATFDCTGRINSACQQPKWRHIATARYSRDWYSVNLRWRHWSALDYINADGTPGTTDQLVIDNGNEVDAYDWFDLSGTFRIGQYADLTVGVNNIADKEPPLTGSTLSGTTNAPNGYDQVGRFFFTSLNLKF